MNGAPLSAADLYHTGIVVADLEASLALLSETAGYRWTQIQSARLPVRLADGEQELQLRYAYSLQAPHVELVQEIPGTPWAVTAPGTAHHLGYFCDDVSLTSKRLAGKGFALEACALIEGQPAVFAYHLSPSGLRIEIVERSLIPDLATYLRDRAAVLDGGGAG